MDQTQAEFYAIVDYFLRQLAERFKGPMKFTLLCRDPDNPECEIVITDDTPDEVIAAVERWRSRPDIVGPPPAEPLATRIRRLREARGLSLDRLSTLAAISKTYLWELEKDTEGAKSPSAKVLGRIAASLGVTLGYLTDGERGED